MKEEELQQLREQLKNLQEEVDRQSRQIAALERRSPVRPVQPARVGSSFSLENFIGLRLIQFIGIIVLVVGLSIGVKYAIDRNLISPLLRIVLAYAAGGLLYGLSVKLRKGFTAFSALLFSGGMASLYFTTYAAYSYYSMFSFSLSFGLMILLTIYTTYEAVRYSRQEIALLGLVGAYSIPFLISKNSDRADLFFLYIGLINCGVVFLSVYKGWKLVGRIAQTITWLLFLTWAASRLQPKWVTAGWAALLFFYALFVGNVLALRIWKKREWGRSDRSQLLLNNIVLYAGTLMLQGPLGLGASETLFTSVTLSMSVFTAAEALAVRQLWRGEEEVARSLAALALFFLVVFIGLQWDGFSVTLLWLLLAVVIFAWGFAWHSVTARLLSMVLIGVTLGKLVLLDSQRFSTVEKVIAYLVLGVLLLITSFFYQKFRNRIFRENEP